MNASSPYAPVPSLNLVSITESLIRLSILSTLLYCPEQNDQDAPIYRRTPHTTTSDLLYDEELQLLEEGSRLSAHDYHSSIQKYVKSLPKDEMEDRIMCDCLLPFLPQSLDQQTRRFRLAFETNDRYPIKKSKNEKYTLTNDRRRLRDDYNALRLLNDCLKAAERNEEIDASIATDLWKQIDILMPRFQALMNVLFMPGVGDMLGNTTELSNAFIPQPKSLLPPSQRYRELRKLKSRIFTRSPHFVTRFYQAHRDHTIRRYRRKPFLHFLFLHPGLQSLLVTLIIIYTSLNDPFLIPLPKAAYALFKDPNSVTEKLMPKISTAALFIAQVTRQQFIFILTILPFIHQHFYPRLHGNLPSPFVSKPPGYWVVYFPAYMYLYFHIMALCGYPYSKHGAKEPGMYVGYFLAGGFLRLVAEVCALGVLAWRYEKDVWREEARERIL